MIKPGGELNTQAVMLAYTRELQSLEWERQKQLVFLFEFFFMQREGKTVNAQPNESIAGTIHLSAAFLLNYSLSFKLSNHCDSPKVTEVFFP